MHLNVVDPQASLGFYQRTLGAVEVSYRGRQPALFLGRSFLLFQQVQEPAPSAPTTALQHIGWAGKDGPNEYAWFRSQGVELQSDLFQIGRRQGFYVFGPDHELIEVWTGGQHHRFDHVHLWATDVEASSRWFEAHLGLVPRVLPRPTLQDGESLASIWMSFIKVDDVNMVLFGRPDFESPFFPGYNYTLEDFGRDDFEPTRGHVIDHLAFSFADIEPVFARMQEAGVEIVEPISTKPETDITSFFVLGPDGLLIEIVEELPIPEGIWK